MRFRFIKENLILLLLISNGAFCADEDAAPKNGDKLENPILSDRDTYKGDKLSFPVNMKLHGIDVAESKISGDVCVPAGVALRAIADYPDGGISALLSNKFGDVIDCEQKTSIENRLVFVNKEQLKNYAPSRYGLSYGALMVPYKYHYNGSKDFSGGATVAPYLGYRFDKNILGVEIKPIVFAGMTKVDVTQNIDGEPTSQSLAGFSYGFGLLGEVKDVFQLGIVIGRDKINESAEYSDNGKTWVSLAIGFSFSN